ARPRAPVPRFGRRTGAARGSRRLRARRPRPPATAWPRCGGARLRGHGQALNDRRKDELPMTEIILEPTGSSDYERCECCGENSRTVWGLARRDGGAHAAYFVHWTLGKVAEKGAHFDLILGRWGEDATRVDRYAVSLEYRRAAEGPAFMVIDATEPPIAHNELVARALRRDEV